MARKPLRALTFSNVCSFLALVVALGTGGSYAAARIDSHDIKNNSIRSIDIKDGQVTVADLGGNAIDGSKVSDGSIANPDLAGNAVDGAKVSDGSIANPDLAGNAVNGAKVADNSIGLADLVGVDQSGAISLSGIPNGRCNQVTFSIAGAVVGQTAVVSTGAALQNGIVLYAQRVSAADHVEVDACNFSGGAMTTISDFPVRVVTFG